MGLDDVKKLSYPERAYLQFVINCVTYEEKPIIGEIYPVSNGIEMNVYKKKPTYQAYKTKKIRANMEGMKVIVDQMKKDFPDIYLLVLEPFEGSENLLNTDGKMEEGISTEKEVVGGRVLK